MGNYSQRVWWFGLGLWVLGSLVLADIVCAQNRVSFLARQNFRVGEGPFSVTVGDFNGDGRQDLATANSPANSVSILLGQGDGTFATAQDVAVGEVPSSVTVGDFNGDGRQDLATAGQASSVSILLGQGDGTFATAQDFAVSGNPASVTVGDFNGDGRQDLATATRFPTSVSILLGQGDGTFATAQDVAVGEVPSSVTVGDFNGDGQQDLATANGATSVLILLGQGDGTFATAQDFAVGERPASVTVGDFNGDGQQDLATANVNANSVSILLGQGDGTFATAQDFGVGAFPASVTVGDFNGDGRQDLATANGDASSVSILINTTPLEVTDVVAFEDLGAGARLTEVFSSEGRGPIRVHGASPLLSRHINAAAIFDSACPPGGIPEDCTGEDMDLGTPNEAFGGPGVGSGGASSNDTALGKVLIIAENVDDADKDRLVDDPNDAGKGGTLHLDFSALGTVTMQSITFVDLDDPDPAQKVELFQGGVKGTLLRTVPLPVAGDNGVSVVPLNTPGVDTVIITLTDSAAIDNISFTPESAAAGLIRFGN